MLPWIYLRLIFVPLGNTMGIWNPTIWNLDFWRSDFKWSGYGYCHSPNHLKTGPFKLQTFSSGFQFFWQNRTDMSGFQMVGLPDFRSHLKSRPFVAQPLFDHSKSRLVWISDSHCTGNYNLASLRSPCYFFRLLLKNPLQRLYNCGWLNNGTRTAVLKKNNPIITNHCLEYHECYPQNYSYTISMVLPQKIWFKQQIYANPSIWQSL